MSQPMIAVAGVTRRFRRTVALHGIDLAIQQGELFGVLGPDGAGKTTLLRALAAVMSPSGAEETPLPRRVLDALRGGEGGLVGRVEGALHNPPVGSITLGGVDAIADPEAVKAQIGYMPQQFGLYGDLSVVENLHFVADLFGVTGETRRQRMDELLDFAGLQRFRGRRVKFLSGGMKKKLALACALLHRPAVLLLDEPTTGVDPVARREFWDLLSGLHADGITTVVSTPYMDEAERCNRVALLHEGRLLACDTPTAIRAQVPGRVLALTAPEPRAARQALAGLPGLVDMQTYGNQLNLIVEGAIDAAETAVRARLDEHGVAITGLERVPVRMEEAFLYLIGQARAQAQGEAV